MRREPEPKIEKLRRAANDGHWREAICIASKFPILGSHKRAIMAAREAFLRPGFQLQIGNDPQNLIAGGIAALREKYDV